MPAVKLAGGALVMAPCAGIEQINDERFLQLGSSLIDGRLASIPPSAR